MLLIDLRPQMKRFYKSSLIYYIYYEFYFLLFYIYFNCEYTIYYMKKNNSHRIVDKRYQRYWACYSDPSLALWVWDNKWERCESKVDKESCYFRWFFIFFFDIAKSSFFDLNVLGYIIVTKWDTITYVDV